MPTHHNPPHEKSKLPTAPRGQSGVLYVVATPIGNLGDMTFRAIETLKNVSLIACEDTRVTRKLLSHFSIHTHTTSYHEHNADTARPALLARLEAGESIALVSDAGTPLISDPGYKLVHDARAKNIQVIPIPGASAAIAALCASGLPTDQFYFIGFLPDQKKARAQLLERVKSLPTTLVIYEAARNLPEIIAALAEALGNRTATVAREITKLHEEFITLPLGELAAHYASLEPKGEAVILIAPAAEETITQEQIDTALTKALAQMSVKEAAKFVAEQLGIGRSDAYQRALEMKK